MRQIGLKEAREVVDAWPDSNHYSLNKHAWRSALDYLYTCTPWGRNVYMLDGMFFTQDDGDDHYEDLHYQMCSHPAAPYGTHSLTEAFRFASAQGFKVWSQGFDNESDKAAVIDSGIALLPEGDFDTYLTTIPASRRSALRRSVRDPYEVEWGGDPSGWAWHTYTHRWTGDLAWAHLQFVYARALVYDHKAVTQKISLNGQQVSECYFIEHEGALKFIAACFTEVNSIGMASQVFAIKHCYELGLAVYDPTARSNFEDGLYIAYKGMVANSFKQMYCYASSPEGKMSPPYAKGGEWVFD